MKRIFLFVIFFVFGFSNLLFSKEKIPKEAVYSIQGNWYEPVENKWLYGFFEDFVVYDGQFWEYSSCQSDKNEVRLGLVNDKGNKMDLTLQKEGDSALLVSSALNKAVQLRKANKYLPHYSIKDTSQFKDTEFHSIDTAYLVGYIRNAPNSSPFTISVTDVLQDKEINFVSDVDSLGRFMVKVPLMNTSQVFMDWRRTHEIAVLQPGESYFFFKDFKTGQTLFMGDNEQFLNEIVQYTPYSPFQHDQEKNERLSKLKGMEFLDGKRKQLQDANAFTGRYLKELPNPSEKLQYFAYNFNKYMVASDIMQKRFELDRVNKERFPEPYMRYVTDSLFLTNISPVTLFRDNLHFLRDYVQYSDTVERSVTYLDSFYEMVIDAEIEVTDQELNVVKTILELDNNGVDSDNEQISNLQASIQYLIDRNAETIDKRDVEKLLIGHSIDFNNDFFKQAFNNNFSFRSLRDIYNINAIMGYLEYSSMQLAPARLSKYLSTIESPLLKQYVLDRNKSFEKLEGVDFRFAKNIKNTDHLAESKDADQLLAEILAPHKGKVVYLDFWGTWCAPCKVEMEHVPAAREALKGKDMVFIYLANRSPEKSWANYIKDKNIEGENVIHYRLPAEQQSIIERRLGVNSFPTYMLVNRKGEFTNVKAPRPSQIGLLVKAVGELLE